MQRAVDDPWERQIKARLDEKLDPDLFEECACDVLRDAYPTLAPVPGGKDRGMDGEIDDGKGEPYPLICTTAKDLEGIRRNLKNSVKRYRDTGGSRRRAVLASPRSLNRDARDSLIRLARENEFRELLIRSQEDFVIRLRHNPHWCQRLLRLSGKPPALSIVPEKRRHLMEIEPIGRDADLEWLRGAREDRLLTGPPGSGKTFLLYHLAREGWGLFLVRDDEAEILQAIAEQKPGVVIVDDAHEDISRLERLWRLREHSGEGFVIVATTWDGDRGHVARALDDLPSSRIHKLEPLTRDEIVEVFRRAGVEVPDQYLMKRLVDQAANKPGLAVTLAQLWLQGDWRAVLEGRALSRSLLPFFERHVGEDAEQLLAAFSLGGDRGMAMEAVAEFLELTRSEVQRKAIALAAGGVLSEAGQGALSVWPRELRSVFLTDVFFRDDGMSLDYNELLSKAPSFDKAVRALIEARGYCEAAVPMDELRDLLTRTRSPEIWALFAELGEEEARWVLEHHPLENWLDIAEPALSRVPRETVPQLLRQAAEDFAATSGSPFRARPPSLAILGGWFREPRVPPVERLKRRRLAADSAREFLQAGGHYTSGVATICLALTPILMETSQDPGSGRRIFKRRAVVAGKELAETWTIWEDVRDVFTRLDALSWSEIEDLLRFLIDPSSFGLFPRPDSEEQMRAFAAGIMNDLAPLTNGNPVFAARLARIAGKIDVELPLERDATFDLLFPQDYYLDEEEESSHRRLVGKLAQRWAASSPVEILRRLRWYRNEASKIGQASSRPLSDLVEEVASRVAEPELWAGIFLDDEADTDFVAPFLIRAVERQGENWEALVDRCLQSEAYLGPVLSAVLRLDPMPPQFVDPVKKTVNEFPLLVMTLCLNREVPESTISLLLDHPDPVIACAAAVGEWVSEPRGQVRPGLRESWGAAILAASPEDIENQTTLSFWLGYILKKNSSLAFEWLRTRLERDELPQVRSVSESLIPQALDVLDAGQRCHLLSDLATMGSSRPWLIPSLVRRDKDVYKELLSNRQLTDHHLAPLAGFPDGTWSEMALLALDDGYGPQEVAGKAFSAGVDWESWEEGFSALVSHPDPRLRAVGEYGRKIAADGLASALKVEKELEKRGFHRD